MLGNRHRGVDFCSQLDGIHISRGGTADVGVIGCHHQAECVVTGSLGVVTGDRGEGGGVDGHLTSSNAIERGGLDVLIGVADRERLGTFCQDVGLDLGITGCRTYIGEGDGVGSSGARNQIVLCSGHCGADARSQLNGRDISGVGRADVGASGGDHQGDGVITGAGVEDAADRGPGTGVDGDESSTVVVDGAEGDVLAVGTECEGLSTGGEDVVLYGRGAGERASITEGDLVSGTSSCDGCCIVVLGGVHRHLGTQSVSRGPTCAFGSQGDGVGTSDRCPRNIDALLEQQRVTRCGIEGIGPSGAVNRLNRHRATRANSREIGVAGKANHRDGSRTSQDQCSAHRNRRGINRDREAGINCDSCIAVTGDHGADASTSLPGIRGKRHRAGPSELQLFNTGDSREVRVSKCGR